MWGLDSAWNPLAFVALWTGAALAMWSLGRDGYPGVMRHGRLALLSVPLWWWFELVNTRVKNWEYVYDFEYSTLEYALLTSLAFSTVVPALAAATAASERLVPPPGSPSVPRSRGLGRTLLVVGVLLQVTVLMAPSFLYPFVWVAPLLILDGLAVEAGGRSLVLDLAGGRWREAAAIAVAGLLCGVLWEFWNFWATPKWVYDVPLLGFGKIFEMPVLGYGGYVPFAWSVSRVIHLADLLARGGPLVELAGNVEEGDPGRR
jgi:hypothetical protein